MICSASKSAPIFEAIFLQKWLQKGSQKSYFFAQIHANRSSGAKGTPKSEKYWKRGMSEMMPKFDAGIVPEK